MNKAPSAQGLGLAALGVAAYASAWFVTAQGDYVPAIYGAAVFALAGLLWSRLVHSYSFSAWLGRVLCETSLTVWPLAVASYYYDGPHDWVGDAWDICVTICLLAMLAGRWLCRRFFSHPANTILGALITALFLALFLSPIFIRFGVVLPSAAGLIIAGKGLALGTVSDSLSLGLYVLTQYAIVVAALLITQWPARHPRPIFERTPEWRREYKLLLCYLIACVCLSVEAMIAYHPHVNSYFSFLASKFMWIPAMPFLEGYHLLGGFGTSPLSIWLYLLLDVFFFSVPLLVSRMIMFNQLPGFMLLIAESREVAFKIPPEKYMGE